MTADIVDDRLSAPRVVPVTFTEDSLLTVYSASWCGHCRRLRDQLDRANIPYEVIDIDKDEQAVEYVKSVNGGNATIPTVRFSDGSSMTNPTINEVRARLVRLAIG